MNILKKLLLVISPFPAAILFGYIYNQTSPNAGNMAVGIHYIFVVVFGIPFIGIVGVITSFLLRNKLATEKLSFYGYLIPAILVWIVAALPIIIG